MRHAVDDPDEGDPGENLENFPTARTPVYRALRIRDGRTYRVWFEAPTEGAAASFCLAHNLGLEGPAAPVDAPPAPRYVSAQAAQEALGVSRSTINREVRAGRLERAVGTRRLLVSRASLEAWGN